MKIVFDDKSYIEIKKSKEAGKKLIIVQSRDAANPLKQITNSVEITDEQFSQLISDI